MTDYYKNFASSTIKGGAGGSGTALNSGDTSLLLQTGDGAQFGASFPLWIVLNGAGPTREICKATAISTDTLTIVRGQDGTSAATWADGTTVDLIIAAAGLTNLWTAINGAVSTGDGQSGVAIPGLAASADILAGGANDWEFDASSTTGWSSFADIGAVSAFDFNTTGKSMAYMKVATNGGSDAMSGLIHAVTPSAPYTITAKISDASIVVSNWPAIFVSDSSTAAGQSVFVGAFISGPPYARGGSTSNLKTLAGLSGNQISTSVPFHTPYYLRIIVHAANNIDILVSQNGLLWSTLHAGYSNLVSAGFFGICCDTFGGAEEMLVDWIRFS